MTLKKYDEAEKAYTDALRLQPGDPAATAALRQATQARLQAVPEPKVAPKIEPKAEVKPVPKIEPKVEPKVDLEAAKRQEDFKRLLTAGGQAMTLKKYDEAEKAYTDALRLQPGDPAATAALRQATQARLQAVPEPKVVPKVEPKVQTKAELDNAKRQEDFKRLVTAGGQAMTLKKYDEAEKAYTDALRLQPGDPAATAALRQATQARLQAVPEPKAAPKIEPKAEVKPVPKVEPKVQPKVEPKADPRAEYNRLMQTAEKLEREKKSTEAIQTYHQALKLIPDDGPALAALRRTELPQLLAAGKAALAVRRFPDATKAFEAALQLNAENAEAKTGLQKARKGTP